MPESLMRTARGTTSEPHRRSAHGCSPRRGAFWSLAAALVLTAGTSQAQPVRPKLVVVLVVDQMRADYIDRYGHQWTAGLRRLVDRGAWFRQAAYPYFNTVTCAGHATISTGALPATHGMVLNAWWDREPGALRTCTADAEAKPVGYGAATGTGESPRRLRVPTFTDELRTQTTPAPKIVSLSLKSRSAIMLAGRRADAVVWLGTGGFVTSSFYTRERVAFVDGFLAANPPSVTGTSWTKHLPAAAYLFDDAAAGEKPPAPWTSIFPHLFGEKVDARWLDAWGNSPFTDAYLGLMARAAVDGLRLGKGPGIDYLGVSFSALDLVGHPFGPRSHEVQDTLARLDVTVGALLDHLDRAVGAGQYVVALSADHGVAPIPEQMAAEGLDAGRMVLDDLSRRVEEALGPGFVKPVARFNYTDLYFTPGVYAKLSADPAALSRVTAALLASPGVARVFRSEELRAPAVSDTLARAVALSHLPERSGDLVVIPKPYWFLVNAGSKVPPGAAATHGTAYAYDARVPVIFMGAGIREGQYLAPATPADIAPTLAFLTGVTLARAEGRVLSEALAHAGASPPVDAAAKATQR